MSVRTVSTSAHGGGMHLCGIQPKPDERRVSLCQHFHPGFGFVSLTSPTAGDVWQAVRFEDDRTLGWMERTLIKDELPLWRLDVEGPMVSYTIERRKRNYWVLASSRNGFA